jgi:hypothetical protein
MVVFALLVVLSPKPGKLSSSHFFLWLYFVPQNRGEPQQWVNWETPNRPPNLIISKCGNKLETQMTPATTTTPTKESPFLKEVWF